MGDWSNLHLIKEATEEHYHKGDDILALVEYYWLDKICAYGEFPVFVNDFHKIWETAQNRFRELKAKVCPILSKTTFIHGTQCEKKLWLYKNRYSERTISPETQAAFDRGNMIGELAQKLFPGAIDINGEDNLLLKSYDYMYIDNSCKALPFYLKQLLKVRFTKMELEKNKALFEAAFLYDENIFFAIDILSYEKGKRIAYEVKSSTEIKDIYIEDSALQYYVMSHNIQIDDFVLVYINNDYLNAIGISMSELTVDNCDINKLFLRKSILSEVLNLQPTISKKASIFKNIISKDKAPMLKMGAQCNRPYECMFRHYCERKCELECNYGKLEKAQA